MQEPGGAELMCGTVLVLSKSRIEFRVYQQNILNDSTDAFLNNLCPTTPNLWWTYNPSALHFQDQPILRPSDLHQCCCSYKRANSKLLYHMAFSLGRKIDNIAPYDFLSTGMVSRMGRKRFKRVTSCLTTQENWKIESFWVQNSSLSCWGAASFPTLHTPRSSSGSVELWGPVRVTQPCQPHPTCIVPDRLGKWFLSSLFPSAVNKQCCHHALESLIALTWAGWKAVCQRKSDQPLRASAVTMAHIECGCHSCGLPVCHQKMMHKHLCHPHSALPQDMASLHGFAVLFNINLEPP